ncbi:MarR family winged helix-turn-helix transcriptional regulator [Sphingobium sp. Cam5-1]|uniref:MarR family winged helix-turn-helix transcriptional regulator n=1 Tax=Sphingobium sp. Cam5-1 TaxID=2789327 RepID=UPI0018AD2517|nr:MarR family winged helix-turn-helix transcriptional regulator [Sphingobium sp. Cam5-1]QPI74640.1 winged helix-turn-helix transcriptional regulator [Sphingobium sp. Cam5-1]
MQTKKRNFPPGVEPRDTINLRRFLPHRIHLLSAKIARPSDFKMPDGKVVRARDWRVILQLASRGPLTNRELSAMVGLDAANITRVVQNLNELGYVTTRTSATDRRKQIISLTAEGAAAHDAIAPQRKQVGEALLECFSPEEAEQFFNFLDRLEDHLQSNVDDDEWIE